MHPVCERNKKSGQYISRRERFSRMKWRIGPQNVIDERESNGKLIRFDDSQV